MTNVQNVVNGLVSKGKGAIVLINEQHSVMDQQRELLNSLYGLDQWSLLKIPSNGLNVDQQEDLGEELSKVIYHSEADIVFASPVPFLLTLLAYADGRANRETGACVKVFHNDQRVKKELPNGKIIYTVAPTGWVIV